MATTVRYYGVDPLLDGTIRSIFKVEEGDQSYRLLRYSAKDKDWVEDPNLIRYLNGDEATAERITPQQVQDFIASL
jgi:hypothetical protein